MDLNGTTSSVKVISRLSGNHGGVGGALYSRRGAELMRTKCHQRDLAIATGIPSASLAAAVFSWFYWCWFGGERDWMPVGKEGTRDGRMLLTMLLGYWSI
jgi:hypothetical protein